MPTLTSLLARDAIVSLDVVEQALQRQVLEGGEIDTALLELAAVPENVLAAYRAASFDLPPAPRAQLERIDPQLIARVPAKLAREFRVLPIALERDVLVLAVDAPLQAMESHRLSSALGVRVAFRVATELRISAALHRHYEAELPERLRALEQRLRSVSPGELCEVRQSTPSREPIAFRHRVSARPPDAGGLRVPFEGGIAEAVRRVSNSMPPPPSSHSSSTTSAVAVASVLASESAGANGARHPSRPPPKPAAAAPAVSKAGSAQRLPRGPITWQQAVELLGEASDRDRILEIFFGFARQYFDCSVLFVVRDERLYPFRSAGLAAAADEEGVSLRMLSGGAVFAASQTLSARVADLRGHSSDASLLGAIGRARFQPCALVPIAIRKRMIGLLYGDRGGEPLDMVDFSEVLPLVPNIGAAFERLIQERKRSAAEGRGDGPAPGPSRGSGGRSMVPPSIPSAQRTFPPPGALPPSQYISPAEPPGRAAPPGAPGSTSQGALDAAAPSARRATVQPPPDAAPSPPPVVPPATPPSEASQRAIARAPSAAVSSDARAATLPDLVPGPAPAPRSHSATATAASVSSVAGDQDVALQPTMQLPSEPIERARRSSQRPPPGAGSYSERGGSEERIRADRREQAKTSPERVSKDPKRPSIGRISLAPPPRTLAAVPPGTGSYSMRPAPPREPFRGAFDPTDPPPPMPPPARADVRPAAESSTAAQPSSPALQAAPVVPAAPAPAPARAEVAALPVRPSSKELPSIVVAQPTVEAERLVEELSRCNPDQGQELIVALVKLGGDGLGALQRRFPGPMWFDRTKPRHRMPSGNDVSAIARAVRAFEDQGVPAIAELLSSPQVDGRLCALLLAAERPRGPLLWPLYQRLFDADGQVRLMALEALPRFRALHEFPELLRLLRDRAGDEREPIPSRLSALEAIGALRDPGSVELLLKLCRHGNRQLSVPAHRSLLVITAQDFGDSERKWKGWLEKNRKRPRVEWLIDSLMHADERVRNTAGLELQKLTQVYYGFVASSSKRDRERAQQRYRDWLRQQGKVPTLA